LDSDGNESEKTEQSKDAGCGGKDGGHGDQAAQSMRLELRHLEPKTLGLQRKRLRLKHLCVVGNEHERNESDKGK